MANQLAYQKIYRSLRDRILHGHYAVGQKIPTERQLCNEFGVSRITTRHAVKLLQDQGLLEALQGRGTFVRSFRSPKFPILNSDYTRSVHSTLPDLKRKILRSGPQVPPPAIAELLGILRVEKCLFALRIDYTPQGAIAFDRVYIPAQFAAGLDENTLARVDFLEIWAQKENFLISHNVETIEALAADTESAEILGLEYGQPVLMATDIIYSQTGAVLGIFESFYRGDKVKLISTVRKGQFDVVSTH